MTHHYINILGETSAGEEGGYTYPTMRPILTEDDAKSVAGDFARLVDWRSFSEQTTATEEGNTRTCTTVTTTHREWEDPDSAFTFAARTGEF